MYVHYLDNAGRIHLIVTVSAIVALQIV